VADSGGPDKGDAPVSLIGGCEAAAAARIGLWNQQARAGRLADKRVVKRRHREVPCLYAINYDISGYDEKDGTLIADYTSELGAHEEVPHRGYAKLLIGRKNTDLIYFLHVEEGRLNPPASGLLHASHVNTGHSFFYGLATGFRSSASDVFIAVRMLWIPRLNEKIQQLSHRVTEEDIGSAAWNGLMRFWKHKEQYEDLYLLAPTEINMIDGEGSVSVRTVVQDFIASTEEAYSAME